MNRVTEVNRAIRATGATERLVRGTGYYYFINVGPHRLPSSGVMVCRASELSVESWMRELEEKRKENQ